MTFNEEANIVRCLESVRWAGDVVVLDSGSTDATVSLASAYPNVRICHRAFTDYADQRNYGLTAIEYAAEWVFVLDADEVVEPGLAAEIRAATSDPLAQQGISAFMVRRRPVLDGAVLGRNISARFWIARLLRVGQVTYHGRVHERVAVVGAIAKLQGKIEHHQFSKGLENWLGRRVSYARMEHEAFLSNEMAPSRWRDAFSPDTLRRRNLLKACFIKLPLRWAIYFVYSLVVTRAFLDGRKGLKYISLEALSYRRADRIIGELRKC